MICETCWEDAYMLSLSNGKAQYECYHELLRTQTCHAPSESLTLEDDDEALECYSDLEELLDYTLGRP